MFLIVLLTMLAQRPITPPPQTPIPETKSRVKATQYKIVVMGCIRNGRLTIANAVTDSLPFDTLNVSEFILDGPNELLRQIREQHNHHYDEIAGIVTVPPPPGDPDAAVETAKKGPVRITAGRRDEKSLGGKSAPQQVKLRVASLTHISEGCVPAR